MKNNPHIAYKTISRLNRRAQEAEKVALRAMRVGLDVAEGLRSLVSYWRREARAQRRTDLNADARTALLVLADARRSVRDTGFGHDQIDAAMREVERVADRLLVRGS